MLVTSPLDLLYPRSCAGCGRRAFVLCDACMATTPEAPPAPAPPGVHHWDAPFAYEGVVREVVARAKYRGERYALAWLAQAAAQCRLRSGSGPVELVVWVPTEAARRRARGFDHAAILARGVARHIGVPCRSLLTRVGAGSQTATPIERRRLGPRLALRAGAVVPASVLVVDDVATTGASLAAAAAVLGSAGTRRVEALTVARTPPPSSRRDRHACGQSLG